MAGLRWPGAVPSGKMEPEHYTLQQDLQDAPNSWAFVKVQPACLHKAFADQAWSCVYSRGSRN